MFKYKDLLTELVKREIKARYKQSILGYAWVVLVPLINLLVMSIVFSFFIRVPTGGIPYPIYLFVALIPWMFTTNTISSATRSLLVNKSLITKVYLPREVFPLSSMLAKLIDVLLYIAVLTIFLFYFGVSIKITVLFLPLVFIFHALLVMGISMILSSLNVFYRDVENLLDVLLMAWMYLTPVLYPPEVVPESVRTIFNFNPMTPIINSYRNITLHGVMPPWESFLYSAVFSVIVFVIGYAFFRNRSKYFADVI